MLLEAPFAFSTPVRKKCSSAIAAISAQFPLAKTETVAEIKVAIQVLEEVASELELELKRVFTDFSEAEIDRIRVIEGLSFLKPSDNTGHQKPFNSFSPPEIYEIYKTRLSTLLIAVKAQKNFFLARLLLSDFNIADLRAQISKHFSDLKLDFIFSLTEREMALAISVYLGHEGALSFADFKQKLTADLVSYFAAFQLYRLQRSLSGYKKKSGTLSEVNSYLSAPPQNDSVTLAKAQELKPKLEREVRGITEELVKAEIKIPFEETLIEEINTQLKSRYALEEAYLLKFEKGIFLEALNENVDALVSMCCSRGCSDCPFRGPSEKSAMERGMFLDNLSEPLFYRIRSRLWPYLGAFIFIPHYWSPQGLSPE